MVHFFFSLLLWVSSCLGENVKVSLWKTDHPLELVLRFNIKKLWHISTPNSSSPVKLSWSQAIPVQSITWPKRQSLSTPFGKTDGYTDQVDCLIRLKNIYKGELTVKVQVPVCNDSMCVQESYTIKPESLPLSSFVPPQSHGFFQVLIFAFLGGIVLNFMPCVFPVLSLKIFSLLKTKNPKRHVLHFGGGVLTSFVILALCLVLIREKVAWGFHLQSPAMIQTLILIFLVLSLNLLGVFEMGTSLARFGSAKPLSSFLEGALMTVVSTPCTGPFMGTALASVLDASYFWVISVFMALGCGVAFPIVMLGFFPSWQSKLPRPGGWMILIKQFFGFCLLGTSVWLLSVFAHQTSNDKAQQMLWIMFFVSFSLWLYGTRYLFSLRWLPWLGMMLCLGCGALFLEIESVQNKAWHPYSEQEINSLFKEKKRYFIDFTAKWCVTCQVNKKRVLRTKAMEEFFAEKKIHLFVADYTSKNKEMEKALNRYRRIGVPVYVAFDGKSTHILPEVLTEDVIKKAFGY